MKKLLLTIINLILIITVIAQAPQGISHQAVIRDANNQLVINTQVGVKISILRDNIEGNIVYSETYTPVSNANGLITFVIGQGTVVSGVFADIAWAEGSYFIKTQVDPSGGINYVIEGVSQILSVPYALHAKTVENLTETDPVFSSWDKSTGIEITESQIIDLDHFTNEDEIDPVFSSWDKSTGIAITESQIIDLNHFTNEDEIDPVFSSWDKSTGIAITESQIVDLDHFTNEDEIDPVFSSWDKSTGIAITESQIIDLDHFTNEDEVDPIFSSWDKSTGIEITESQIIDLDHFTNADEIDPVFLSWDRSTGIEITESQIIDLNHFTNEDEIDPVFSSWDKSTGIAITESQIVDLDHFTNEDEIDPVFSSWDKSTGIAITESQIIDLNHFTNEDEIDPVFSSWDKSTGIEITESQIIDLDHFTNEDEIDPVFSSWDKSTGIAITESQIIDLNHFTNEEEIDPVFSSWDKSTGIEITESQIIDLDHFTNEDEVDPVFSSWDKSTGIEITESQIIDLDHFTNEDEIDPVFLSWDKSTGIEITESQIIDLDHFTNEDEIDPVFSSWDKSTGIEITESQITDLKDYLTEEADGDPTNELQTVVQEDYKVTLSHDGGSFITGIMSYAQAEIDAMVLYDGLTVHNSTTNCINYYYFNNWFEFCGTCTPQPTQADAGENIWIQGGVLTITLSANIPAVGEGKWSILSGDGGSFEDDTDPHTLFTGQDYEQYTLKWTITTSCNTSYDEIWVRFRPYVCGTPFTDTRDSNDYETVIIGNQCWMAENLKYLPEVSGPEEQSYTEPYYYVNGYDGTNVNDAKASTYYNAYGVLYNWPAAVNACPLGWHLPSDAEWTQLVDYLASQGYPNGYDDPNGAGNALKSCRQENSPLGEDCATSEHPRWDSNNTHYGFDEFGFSALPGGLRNGNGLFYSIGYPSYWWSSNEYSSSSAWHRGMSYNYGDVNRSSSFKTHGYSVRCLRD